MPPARRAERCPRLAAFTGQEGRVLATVAPWAASAGTHPVGAIDPGAIDAAWRRQLSPPRRRPPCISGVQEDGDLVIPV